MEVFKRPPALRIWIESPDKVDRYFRSILRMLSAARCEHKPATVRAYCGDAAIAEEWARVWAERGVEVERLLGCQCFFSLSIQALRKMLDLPEPRPATVGATLIN